MDCDKILQTDGGSIITGLRCFSLPLILDCGQAFRWSENADGSWSGVAMNRELRLKQDGDRLFFENTTPDEIKNIWIMFFLPFVGVELTKIDKFYVVNQLIRDL